MAESLNEESSIIIQLDEETDLALVEDLIQQVKLRPILYQFGNDDYRNKVKTAVAWTEVATGLKKSGKCTNLAIWN
jgi:hypothetical protein